MQEQRDLVREDLFNNAYKIKPEIYISYDLNDDNTFKIFALRFILNNKDWILTEYYDGNKNLTNFCTLTGIKETFKRFIDAEKRLVEIIKNGKS